MNRLRILGLAAIAAVTLLGCGVEAYVETTGTTEPAVATDATAGEFVYLLEADKRELVREVVAGTPACAGTEVDSAMLIVVSLRASEGDPDRPVRPIVEGACADV